MTNFKDFFKISFFLKIQKLTTQTMNFCTVSFSLISNLMLQKMHVLQHL